MKVIVHERIKIPQPLEVRPAPHLNEIGMVAEVRYLTLKLKLLNQLGFHVTVLFSFCQEAGDIPGGNSSISLDLRVKKAWNKLDMD